MYHQMKGRFSFTFLVLVFASMVSLTSLEILSNALRSTDKSQSNISTKTMRNILAGVTNLDETSLQFLYGSEYEDVMNHLAEILSSLFIGQMRLKNDGKLETLQQLLLPSPRPVLLVVLERTIKIIQIFEKIRRRMLDSHLVKWLVIMEDESGDNSIVEIGELINEGTHVTICKMNPEGNCDLFFPYVDSKGITRFTRKATIMEKQTTAKNLPRYYSLSGRQMILATKEAIVSVTLGRTLPDGSVEVDSGIAGNILKTLSIKLNFTYRAFLPEDNKFGNVETDGSVTGVLGMVVRREATFEFSGLILSESRESVANSAWFALGDSTLMLSRSPKEKSKALAVLSPFKLKVWVTISMSVLFMGPVTYVFSHFLKQNKADFKTDLTWYEFNMFRSIVNQGVLIKELSISLRVILSFWLLFCLIYTATYSGMLTAMFTLPSYETPIDYLEDLPRAVKKGFTIGTLDGGSQEQFLKTSPDGIFKQTWNLFNHKDRSKSFVGSHMEGTRRALSKNFVYITSNIIGRYVLRVFGVEKLYLSRETFNQLTYGFACQKGSPVRDTIFYKLLQLQDAGLIFKWMDDEFLKIPQSQSTDGEEKKSFAISFTHLQAAFYMLSIGMSIASVTLVLERLIFYKTEGKNCK